MSLNLSLLSPATILGRWKVGEDIQSSACVSQPLPSPSPIAGIGDAPSHDDPKAVILASRTGGEGFWKCGPVDQAIVAADDNPSSS